MSQNLGDINFADDVRGALNATLLSDLKNNALQCHAVMKVAGNGEGLYHLCRMPSARSNRNRVAATLQLTPAPAA